MESSMSCGQMIKFSMSKIIMEMIGTAFLTLFFISGSEVTVLLGLWILTIFFWKITGSHFNPAVTFALMFRKDDRKISVKLGIAYICAQLLGGYLGALLANFYTYNLVVLDYNNWFRAILQELLVSFFFVFFFQISTDEKLLFSNEKAINCFIIASSYIGARAIFAGNGSVSTNYGAVANPAIALGICLAGLFGNGIKSFEAIWMYPTLPFAGAILAVLFYEIIYKKTQKVFSNVDDDGSDDLGNSSGGEHD